MGCHNREFHFRDCNSFRIISIWGNSHTMDNSNLDFHNVIAIFLLLLIWLHINYIKRERIFELQTKFRDSYNDILMESLQSKDQTASIVPPKGGLLTDLQYNNYIEHRDGFLTKR